MTVFANGLEISWQGAGQQGDRRLPRRLLHAAANPATPPGVPVPYPDFGMDSDLTSGSGTREDRRQRKSA